MPVDNQESELSPERNAALFTADKTYHTMRSIGTPPLFAQKLHNISGSDHNLS
jgi:hypothetical protein